MNSMIKAVPPATARFSKPPSPPLEVVFMLMVEVIQDIAPVSEYTAWSPWSSIAKVCWMVPRIWYFNPLLDCALTSGTVGRSGMLILHSPWNFLVGCCHHTSNTFTEHYASISEGMNCA